MAAESGVPPNTHLVVPKNAPANNVKRRGISIGVREDDMLRRKTLFKSSTRPPLKRTRMPHKPKRHKKGELTKLKEELWSLTRLIVFKTYGSDCYTCPQKNLEGSNRQGGHMPWHSSELSIPCKFDIRYVRAQCFNCNMRKGGKGGTANQRMRAEGIDVDALERHNQETKGRTYPLQWFRDKIQEYELILKELSSDMI